MKRYAAKWQALDAEWESLRVGAPVKSGELWTVSVRLNGRFEVPGDTPEAARRNAEKILEVIADMTAQAEAFDAHAHDE